MNNLKTIYKSYPKDFWVLAGSMFIDRIGTAFVFPFLALFISTRFNVGLTQVGQTLAIYFGGAFFGNMVGGALADKFGRKITLIIGLVLSAFSSLAMGLVNDWQVFVRLVLVAGVFSELGAPAIQAMIADILPVAKRMTGLGILRVVINLAVTIGPAIGGMLAGINFLYLFLGDVIVSSATAVIVAFALPETKPALAADQAEESMLQSLAGYWQVLKHKTFMAVIFLSMLTAVVYMQLNTTLSVFLGEIHGVSAQSYGYLLSMSACLVVLFQFPVTRRVRHIHPLRVLMVGNLFFGLGFGLFALTQSYWQFVISILIITIGRMLYGPVIQALIAAIAPEDVRGRYMAVFHTVWVLAAGIAPWAAGFVFENINPFYIWVAAGILSVIVAIGYRLLLARFGHHYTQTLESKYETMA